MNINYLKIFTATPPLMLLLLSMRVMSATFSVYCTCTVLYLLYENYTATDESCAAIAVSLP